MSNLFRLPERDHSGLILMVKLAEKYSSGDCISLKDVACRMRLSQGYLEEVAANLKRAGLIKGKQGPSGGYRLSRAPEKITLEEIVIALEGPVELIDCTAGGVICPIINVCPSRRVWTVLEGAIVNSLKSITLSQAI